ncbi:hypothetical protein FRC18_011643, partial [Serendipita sp. 400]
MIKVKVDRQQYNRERGISAKVQAKVGTRLTIQAGCFRDCRKRDSSSNQGEEDQNIKYE